MTLQKVVLFDIDYTLFNTDRFREIVYPAIAKKIDFQNTEVFYDLARNIELILKDKQGHFSPQAFLKELSHKLSLPVPLEELAEIFSDESVYIASLFENVEEILESLSEHGVLVGILSTGNTAFQRQKIQKIVRNFEDEHMHIFVNKIVELPDIINTYKGKTLYIVDDLPKVLEEAKKLDSGVITIRVDTPKKYEPSAIMDGFTPDHTITNIAQVTDIVLEK